MGVRLQSVLASPKRDGRWLELLLTVSEKITIYLAMTTAPSSPTESFSDTLERVLASIAMEGTRKGQAGALAMAILHFLETLVALLADFKAGRFVAVAPSDSTASASCAQSTACGEGAGAATDCEPGGTDSALFCGPSRCRISTAEDAENRRGGVQRSSGKIGVEEDAALMARGFGPGPLTAEREYPTAPDCAAARVRGQRLPPGYGSTFFHPGRHVQARQSRSTPRAMVPNSKKGGFAGEPSCGQIVLMSKPKLLRGQM